MYFFRDLKRQWPLSSQILNEEFFCIIKMLWMRHSYGLCIYITLTWTYWKESVCMTNINRNACCTQLLFHCQWMLDEIIGWYFSMGKKLNWICDMSHAIVYLIFTSLSVTKMFFTHFDNNRKAYLCDINKVVCIHLSCGPWCLQIRYSLTCTKYIQ